MNYANNIIHGDLFKALEFRIYFNLLNSFCPKHTWPYKIYIPHRKSIFADDKQNKPRKKKLKKTKTTNKKLKKKCAKKKKPRNSLTGSVASEVTDTGSNLTSSLAQNMSPNQEPLINEDEDAPAEELDDCPAEEMAEEVIDSNLNPLVNDEENNNNEGGDGVEDDYEEGEYEEGEDDFEEDYDQDEYEEGYDDTDELIVNYEEYAAEYYKNLNDLDDAGSSRDGTTLKTQHTILDISRQVSALNI